MLGPHFFLKLYWGPLNIKKKQTVCTSGITQEKTCFMHRITNSTMREVVIMINQWKGR